MLLFVTLVHSTGETYTGPVCTMLWGILLFSTPVRGAGVAYTRLVCTMLWGTLLFSTPVRGAGVAYTRLVCTMLWGTLLFSTSVRGAGWRTPDSSAQCSGAFYCSPPWSKVRGWRTLNPPARLPRTYCRPQPRYGLASGRIFEHLQP
ncbi:MAG: hypothetical protein ACOX5T_07785 [Candidatus Cryptobacteroides sp.]